MARLRTGPEPDSAANLLSLALTHWLRQLKPQDLFVTCISCKHLQDDGRTCGYDSTTPAAHVVLTGCEYYKDRMGYAVSGEKAPPSRTPQYSYGLDDEIPF